VAEPLKDRFGPEVAVSIGAEVAEVVGGFDRERFIAACLGGYESLELTDRARHIAAQLARFLVDEGPLDDRGQAIVAVTQVVTDGEPAQGGMLEGFWYLPFVFFVADEGLDHFEASMTLQRELTTRFTAEFSIRAFIEAHPDQTLARLDLWATDPDEHVRRLVSEGTRPRLPWAPRLRTFQQDPAPVLALLEQLKDDPSEYVRRSVANNLNDISKDHPEVVIEVADRWWPDGGDERRRLVQHGLRTLIKAGDPDALAVLGYRTDSPVLVDEISITPDPVTIGDSVRIEVSLTNPEEAVAPVLVDLRVGFVKADGSVRPKVFKGAERQLEPGQSTTVRKTVSLAQHSTRTHHPGTHEVEVMVNGVARTARPFEVADAG
jgi:3-methyladenine DNA glycosylase AlkC